MKVLFDFILLVYQLQQKAPRPIRIICNKTVSVILWGSYCCPCTCSLLRHYLVNAAVPPVLFVFRYFILSYLLWLTLKLNPNTILVQMITVMCRPCINNDRFTPWCLYSTCDQVFRGKLVFVMQYIFYIFVTYLYVMLSKIIRIPDQIRSV